MRNDSYNDARASMGNANSNPLFQYEQFHTEKRKEDNTGAIIGALALAVGLGFGAKHLLSSNSKLVKGIVKEPESMTQKIDSIKPLAIREVTPQEVKVEPAIKTTPIEVKTTPIIVKPIKPITPVEPIKQVELKEQVTPVKPVESIEPIKPIELKEPIKPVKSVKSVEPGEQIKPEDKILEIKPSERKIITERRNGVNYRYYSDIDKTKQPVTVDQISKALKYLPNSLRKHIENIALHEAPLDGYPNALAAASQTSNQLYLFGTGKELSTHELANIFAHEAGHLVDKAIGKKIGTEWFTNSKTWLDATKKDLDFSNKLWSSSYAERHAVKTGILKANKEDFADSIRMIYFPFENEKNYMTKMFPNRTKLIEEMFGLSNSNNHNPPKLNSYL